MNLSYRAIAWALLAASSAAHAADMTPPAPPNKLGQQDMTPPPIQVVYPSISNIVESQVRDIEELQLTPDQIKRLKEASLRRDQERSLPYNKQPLPVTRSLAVNLDPGIVPPMIRLARGQLSSLVFSDAAGQPWYISGVAMNRDLFSDGRSGAGGGQGGSAGQQEAAPTNVLSIEPLSTSAYGNVTVTLRGLPTPVIFVLSTGQNEVDLRVDAKIPGRNPDGDTTSDVIDMPRIDDSLTAFLDNVPPKDAKRLSVTGMSGVDAWYYQDSLYLRTKGEAQHPAYLNAARSTSGTWVYRFQGAHSSVTLLSGGQAVTVFIQ